MKNSILIIFITVLAGCQADTENKTEITITTAPTRVTPTSIAAQQHTTTIPTQRPALSTQQQTGKRIYKCTLPNGTTAYTDKECDSPEKVISIEKFHANSSPPVANYAYQQTVSISKQQQAIPNAYQKPSSYEINTRYDNLAREINSIIDHKDKSRLNQVLRTLEQDRTHALSMRAEVKQSHDIHTRFDNMAREARARSGNSTLAHELLKIERQRNAALYRNDVTF
ncbi:MAG: hypothetical protein BWK73_47170 [Thiothrix lacustris]|uniref:DUF4124 domain-containing protein n=1 Tax=Thiothrix lacustris TaxID=525917 RepID=A0A1Y1QA11_9GAMM|nr:MAG: hypothetical protein BWK73_47170 [Thiothrix lacustris]